VSRYQTWAIRGFEKWDGGRFVFGAIPGEGFVEEIEHPPISRMEYTAAECREVAALFTEMAEWLDRG
jgi:hypothetical protein